MERPIHEAPIDNQVSPMMKQILSDPCFYPLPPIPTVEPTLEPTNDFPEDMEVLEEGVAPVSSPPVPPSDEYVTDINVIKFSCPGDKRTGDILINPEFPDVCWQLILYPGGKREENAGTVSLFLKMSSRKPEQEARVKAEYQFMFLNDNEEKVFTNINGLRNIPRATVERALRNDGSLVIRLEIEIMKDVFKTKPKVHEDPIDNFVSPAMEQILSKSFSTLSLAPIPAVEPTLEFTDDLPENMEVIIVEKDVPPKIYDEFDAELIN
ncbi:hypothetical protein L5515_002838 [Caenorhabditis briggsae]|uniref:MATH domain-containing protein n=1 Tax=Caenorhabditis briggsae TaxID=6238 RepID=A0AAE9EA13_CAEBR|nr:hypothetical protein L5515_002838 [Caenorhabditis briggsae]